MQSQTPLRDERVSTARAAVLDGVGREVAASFPGITRLGGQIVAALYLADAPLSMDALSEDLERSKSNIFANLRALEAAGIVGRHRASGSRYDTFALRGKYPDVIVGAYLSRLRRVVIDKVELCDRGLGLLGDAEGPEADALRDKLRTLQKKYERFATVFAEIIPVTDGPVDLEEILDNIPAAMMAMIGAMAARAGGAAEGRQERHAEDLTSRKNATLSLGSCALSVGPPCPMKVITSPTRSSLRSPGISIARSFLCKRSWRPSTGTNSASTRRRTKP